MPSSLQFPLGNSPSNATATTLSDESLLRLKAAEAALASRDPFLREAGAQMLAGFTASTAPEALRLLEKALTDPAVRVVEGALRALAPSLESGDTEAETLLLTALFRNPRLQELLKRRARSRSEPSPPKVSPPAAYCFGPITPIWSAAASGAARLDTSSRYRRIAPHDCATTRRSPPSLRDRTPTFPAL